MKGTSEEVKRKSGFFCTQGVDWGGQLPIASQPNRLTYRLGCCDIFLLTSKGVDFNCVYSLTSYHSWDYKPWSNTGHLKKDQPDNAEFGINK